MRRYAVAGLVVASLLLSGCAAATEAEGDAAAGDAGAEVATSAPGSPPPLLVLGGAFGASQLSDVAAAELVASTYATFWDALVRVLVTGADEDGLFAQTAPERLLPEFERFSTSAPTSGATVIGASTVENAGLISRERSGDLEFITASFCHDRSAIAVEYAGWPDADGPFGGATAPRTSVVASVQLDAAGNARIAEYEMESEEAC